MGPTGVASSEPPQPDNAMTPLANNSAVAARPKVRFISAFQQRDMLIVVAGPGQDLATGVRGNFQSRTSFDGLSCPHQRDTVYLR